MTAFFVTATGTDIGKTYVTAGLVRPAARGEGGVGASSRWRADLRWKLRRQAIPCMLLEAMGEPVTDETLVADLALAVCGAAVAGHGGRARRARRSNSMRWWNSAGERPRKRMGRISSKAWAASWCRSMRGTRCATGWRRSGLPVILVAGSYLGTISHTLTALEVLARNGCASRPSSSTRRAESAVPLADTIGDAEAGFRARVPIVALQARPTRSQFAALWQVVRSGRRIPDRQKSRRSAMVISPLLERQSGYP